MTNFEKYHEEMIEKKLTAVKNGKPVSCAMLCQECDIYDGVCRIELIKWLAEEYKEPKPKLTEKEMYLCKAFNSGYIARDESRVLHFYAKKPRKGLTGWWTANSIYTVIPPNLLFSFIKWEDKEPHSIEEMLTWDVEK